jgi:hypothetical protein
MYLSATNAVPIETKTAVQFTSKLINKMIEKITMKTKFRRDRTTSIILNEDINKNQIQISIEWCFSRERKKENEKERYQCTIDGF